MYIGIYIYIRLVIWCLTPLSTIFQLYRGGQFYWWTKPEHPEKPPIYINLKRNRLYYFTSYKNIGGNI